MISIIRSISVKAISVVVLLAPLSHAQASPSKVISKVFESTYSTGYEQNNCGKNILRLTQAVSRQMQTNNDLRMVQVENKGIGIFGMVNAEAARSQIRGKPAVEEKNWYFHVFAIDSSDFIYDYDYMTTPTIENTEVYIEKMFLDEEECENPNLPWFCGGRDRKLNDYVITVFAVPPSGSDDLSSIWKGSLREFLSTDRSRFFE